MDTSEDKNIGFFRGKTEQIITKVEKTPMDKFFVFFLILISISAVVLGFMQFKKDIEGPALSAYLNRKRGELLEKYKPSQAATAEEQSNRLKNQDSDLDGLDDWSEINVYGTSPYLTDSDNDGSTDMQEITRGTNPTCPEGIDCFAIGEAPTVVNSGGTNINSVINNIADSDLETIMQYEQDLLSGEITLEQLGINNAELQNLFDQMRAMPDDQQANLNSDEKEQALAALKNLTPAQLRAELLSKGMDQATLDQFDDESLQQMLEQIISAY